MRRLLLAPFYAMGLALLAVMIPLNWLLWQAINATERARR